jgi:hypothetical protein
LLKDRLEAIHSCAKVLSQDAALTPLGEFGARILVPGGVGLLRILADSYDIGKLTYGTVISWSDTQIVAAVASISTSGTVQVQESGLSSNSVPFTVNTATISNIYPMMNASAQFRTETPEGRSDQAMMFLRTP